MTSDQALQPPAPAKPKDSRGKLVFLVIGMAAIFAVYMLQRTDPVLKDWNKDLPAALAQAAAENRPLLVFFDSAPPSETGRDLVRTTFFKNDKALTDGHFIRVHVALGGLTDPLAVKYHIRSMPTTLVLDSSGIEKNRREGKIGELPFRNGFLDCSEVQPPPAETAK